MSSSNNRSRRNNGASSSNKLILSTSNLGHIERERNKLNLKKVKHLKWLKHKTFNAARAKLRNISTHIYRKGKNAYSYLKSKISNHEYTQSNYNNHTYKIPGLLDQLEYYLLDYAEKDGSSTKRGNTVNKLFNEIKEILLKKARKAAVGTNIDGDDFTILFNQLTENQKRKLLNMVSIYYGKIVDNREIPGLMTEESVREEAIQIMAKFDHTVLGPKVQQQCAKLAENASKVRSGSR
jgi:hypothetical protein